LTATGAVVQFAKPTVTPKQTREAYNKQNITVSFDPDTKKWCWEVEYISTILYDGVCQSEAQARKEARKLIDKLTVP
jgi:hypothetical protein